MNQPPPDHLSGRNKKSVTFLVHSNNSHPNPSSAMGFCPQVPTANTPGTYPHPHSPHGNYQTPLPYFTGAPVVYQSNPLPSGGPSGVNPAHPYVGATPGNHPYPTSCHPCPNVGVCHPCPNADIQPHIIHIQMWALHALAQMWRRLGHILFQLKRRRCLPISTCWCGGWKSPSAGPQGNSLCAKQASTSSG